MNLRTLEQHHLMDIYESYAQPVPFFKYIEVEREFKLVPESTIVFDCEFEVELQLWRDNEGFPSVQCVSAVDAYCGGHKVTNPATINALNAIAEAWAKENVDELSEEARNK